MDHFELVEKLREKANVSYEDAKRALEATNWDLLDAMVMLEGEGKIHAQAKANYTTRPEPRVRTAQIDDSTRGFFSRFFKASAALVNKANQISLDVRKQGKTVFSLPLTALVLLLLFAFWLTIPAMVVGLFFGLRYSISGPNIGETVNRVMDSVADKAEQIRSGVGAPQRNDEQRGE